MAFGPSPIRFLRRPSEDHCSASAWRTILKLPRFEKPPPATVCFCYYSCYYFRSICSLSDRINAGDSFKCKRGVDNKRHTNAHRPFTSFPPNGTSIPPSPPYFKGVKNPANRLFLRNLFVGLAGYSFGVPKELSEPIHAHEKRRRQLAV
jgi:hypothetical protein